VDEDPAEVVRVLLHPVVQRLDLFLVEEPQHPLLELTGALSRDDLSISGALLATASSMIARSARSMSPLRL
jgi:hypothetical protein